MKIEFAENDGYLHEDGQPKIFTFRVDGRMYPCPADTTIGEFYRRVQMAKPAAAESTAGQDLKPTPVPQHVAENGHSKGLFRNDTVRYLGALEEGKRVQPRDNEDLVMNREYHVVDVKNGTVDIMDVAAPTPIRLTVKKSDVELVRKGIRVISKEEFFEKTVACSNTDCSETVALRKPKTGDPVYRGTCAKCGTQIAEAHGADGAKVVLG